MGTKIENQARACPVKCQKSFSERYSLIQCRAQRSTIRKGNAQSCVRKGPLTIFLHQIGIILVQDEAIIPLILSSIALSADRPPAPTFPCSEDFAHIQRESSDGTLLEKTFRYATHLINPGDRAPPLSLQIRNVGRETVHLPESRTNQP